MPQFVPGEAKTARAPITVQPSGLSCSAELYLVSNGAKVATSGVKTFTSTGARQNISLPITMPSAEGTYPVYLDILAEGLLIGAYKSIEDVSIARAYKVSVGFKRERVCETTRGGECIKYYAMERRGTITLTNEGPPGDFTTALESWFYLSGVRGSAIARGEWTDYFEASQIRVYRFNYIVPVTGMPLDTRFFIKVKDPDGKIIADKVFITSL